MLYYTKHTRSQDNRLKENTGNKKKKKLNINKWFNWIKYYVKQIVLMNNTSEIITKNQAFF